MLKVDFQVIIAALITYRHCTVNFIIGNPHFA